MIAKTYRHKRWWSGSVSGPLGICAAGTNLLAHASTFKCLRNSLLVIFATDFKDRFVCKWWIASGYVFSDDRSVLGWSACFKFLRRATSCVASLWFWQMIVRISVHRGHLRITDLPKNHLIWDSVFPKQKLQLLNARATQSMCLSIPWINFCLPLFDLCRPRMDATSNFQVSSSDAKRKTRRLSRARPTDSSSMAAHFQLLHLEDVYLRHRWAGDYYYFWVVYDPRWQYLWKGKTNRPIACCSL